MRIESEIKLDFSDVLIKPKRSTLGSRKEVDLNRFYEFRNALDNASFMGVPIMASILLLAMHLLNDVLLL